MCHLEYTELHDNSSAVFTGVHLNKRVSYRMYYVHVHISLKASNIMVSARKHGRFLPEAKYTYNAIALSKHGEQRITFILIHDLFTYRFGLRSVG